MSSESLEKQSISPKSVEPDEEKSSSAIGNGDNQGSGAATARKIPTAAEMVHRLMMHRRIQTLRKLQVETTEIEMELERRLNELEGERAQRLEHIQMTRKEIVAGEREPTVEECDIDLEYDEGTFAKKLKHHLKVYEDDKKRQQVAYYTERGLVPHFWLVSLLNGRDHCDSLLIEYPADGSVLRDLIDIDVEYSYEPMKFVLNFHFSPNDAFSNEILTKEFIVKAKDDAKQPFDIDNAEIVETKGCTIDWKLGVDMMKCEVDYEIRDEITGKLRKVNRMEEYPSFFRFFEEPDEKKVSHRWTFKCHADVGNFLRRVLIPKATLFYTREIGNLRICESDLYGEEDAEEEEDTDEEEEGTDEDADKEDDAEEEDEDGDEMEDGDKEETDKNSDGDEASDELIDDGGNEEPPEAAKDKRTK